MDDIIGLESAIGTAVREARRARGGAQAQLTGFAGLSEAYIAKLEQGRRGDSVTAPALLAGAFGMQPSELMRSVEAALAAPKPPARMRGRPRKT
ncbi:MAG: helix-turn-helix transcriptional regulator [Desulfovibrio desulfuricans]|nr:helix-turn-helix transcriptional regulator [Desulfovibrio desulfuricans]